MSISSTVYTMHLAAIAAIFPRPRVHWPAPSQNGSSRARSQSDNGVAELMPCQESSDVEDFSHTTRTHTFSRMLHATCYVLTCCYLPRYLGR